MCGYLSPNQIEHPLPILPARVMAMKQTASIEPVATRPTAQRAASATLTDHRPAAVAQRKLAESIAQSPFVVAQRKQLAGMFGAAVQKKGAEEELLQGKFPVSQAKAVQRYQYINSDPPSRKDAQIYGIYKNPESSNPNPKYVGQTTIDRAGARFLEHVKEDEGTPWYGMTITSDDSDWAYVPRQLEFLGNVTKFEVTAAEQYWFQNYGGKSSLISTSGGTPNQPMLKDTFNYYKTIKNNYDAKNIQLGNSWKPTDS